MIRTEKRKENAMLKTLFEKFEILMAAVAFSESGEFETARQIMNEDKTRKTNRPSSRNHKRPSPRIELRAE
jgi:hypothetical protein